VRPITHGGSTLTTPRRVANRIRKPSLIPQAGWICFRSFPGRGPVTASDNVGSSLFSVEWGEGLGRAAPARISHELRMLMRVKLLPPAVFPLTPHPDPLPKVRENLTQRFRIPTMFPVGGPRASVLPLLGERAGVRGRGFGRRTEGRVSPLALGFRTPDLAAACSNQDSEEPLLQAGNETPLADFVIGPGGLVGRVKKRLEDFRLTCQRRWR
jgi:hypothetical protein